MGVIKDRFQLNIMKKNFNNYTSTAVKKEMRLLCDLWNATSLK